MASFFNKLKFFKEDITDKLLQNEEECEKQIKEIITKRKQEQALILEVLKNTVTPKESSLSIIKMDSLEKEVSKKFSKSFLLHLLLLTNFLSKIFEIKNLKHRYMLISTFVGTFAKMIESNTKIENTISYKEQPIVSMGNLSSVLIIEEYENIKENDEDAVCIVNNEILDFSSKDALKDKVYNIYRRGMIAMRYPESMSARIILKISCMILDVLYNIYMGKNNIKKKAILENLKVADRIIKEYIISPLLCIIYATNETQINQEYKHSIQLLNRKPDDINDQYKWYYDFDELLKMIDFSK